MSRPRVDATIARINGILSPSAENNVRALAECLALQIVQATNNNVEAAFKFLDVAKLVNSIINERAPSA